MHLVGIRCYIFCGICGLSEFLLVKATLLDIHLSDTNMSFFNLTGANLTRAELSEANLSGANLIGAKLKHVRNLDKAKNVTAEQLAEAKNVPDIDIGGSTP